MDSIQFQDLHQSVHTHGQYFDNRIGYRIVVATGLPRYRKETSTSKNEKSD